MDKPKRERSINFTYEETELLVSLAAAKRNIIESKKSDSTTWNEKEKAWKAIEALFNRASGAVFRDHKHLKQKYEAIKRDTRKKSALVRANSSKTGRGSSTAPVLTPAELKVMEIMRLSVDGNESNYESDLALQCTSTSGSMLTWSPADNTPEQTSRDGFNNFNINIIKEEISEPSRKRLCEALKDGGALPCESQLNHTQNNQWREWNQSPGSMPKENGYFDTLTETKIEIANLQKKILEKELLLKEKELEHQSVTHELEEQHLLLKIELLKKELRGS